MESERRTLHMEISHRKKKSVTLFDTNNSDGKSVRLDISFKNAMMYGVVTLLVEDKEMMSVVYCEDERTFFFRSDRERDLELDLIIVRACDFLLYYFNCRVDIIYPLKLSSLLYNMLLI